MEHRCQRTTLLLIGALLVPAALSGCGPTTSRKPVDQSAVYYPPPPAPPRLQFLTSFRDAERWANPNRDSSFAEWIAGTPREQRTRTSFESPYGLDARSGVLYICDVALDCVHVVDIPNGEYRRLGPDRTRNPVNITIAPDGTKYVCDTGAGQVLVFGPDDQFLDAFGEPGAWTPLDLALRGDELFVTDVTGGQIHVWSRSGHRFLRTIGEKGRGPDQLTNPTNLAFGPDGRLYVTDSFQQMVKVFDEQGRFVDSIGEAGIRGGQFARPKGIAIDEDGVMFVADSQWDVVQMFNTDGRLLMLFGEPGEEPHSMGLPAGVCIDRTSMPQFEQFIARDFEAEYLLFVVNQFGRNKVAVYAFGQGPAADPEAYQAALEEAQRSEGSDDPAAPTE
jgi:sugar lactone lactonase YvrE